MRPPRQDRSRESTERVLEAVLGLLATEGVGAVTTARVAAASGTSNGTIYHRFGSRQALLLGAYDLFTTRLHAMLDGTQDALAGTAPTLDEAVRLLVGVYVGVFEEHGALIRGLVVAAVTEPALAERGALGKLDLARQVRRALEPYRDQVLAPDPGRAYEMVHRILFGHLAMRTLFHDDPVDPPAVDALRAAVLGVLRPAP